jgi:hypothetical protein
VTTAPGIDFGDLGFIGRHGFKKTARATEQMRPDVDAARQRRRVPSLIR